MPEDLMRYDQLAQDALRGVVRQALKRVQQQGLPGSHHFYIEFETPYPGVELSVRMREKYPREMTVVMQHQFHNLLVHEDKFEVELSFDNVREKLVIPFNAVKNFFDPAVPFGMRFEVVQEQPAADASRTPLKPVAAKLPKKREDASKQPAKAAPAAPSENIVSLDSFRKK
jgi:uncharacterized protein